MTGQARPVGGEQHFRGDSGCFAAMCDSGRSALRLLLRGGLRERRFLLPDFLCEVIPRVLDAEGCQYAFYRVTPDLRIDPESVRGQRFEVLYVIDYFGRRTEAGGLVPAGGWLVEDAVFAPRVERPAGVENWAGFNSLRKISWLADGSLVKSTTGLALASPVRGSAPFASTKYLAKREKRAFLECEGGSEEGFLALFARGEREADSQSDIYTPSAETVAALPEVFAGLNDEYLARRRNYEVLHGLLADHAIDVAPEFPCFYVLSVDRRDELRSALVADRIFLPGHWPNPRGSDNPLYRRLLAIPVDSRYGPSDMQRVAECIRRFLES